MTEAKILSSPPISGSIDEVHFAWAGNCTWVQFTDCEYEEWCGIFGQGEASSANSSLVDAKGNCFVIAHGQGYFININSRQLTHKTENEWLISAVSIPERDMFVACDWTNLYVYSDQGLLWQSQRVSVDGIIFTDVSKSQVKGQVWDLEEWVDFVLNVDGWTYSSEFECDF